MEAAPTKMNNEAQPDTKLPDARQLIEDMRKALERVDMLVRRRILEAFRSQRDK
jgi:hypothetical protein